MWTASAGLLANLTPDRRCLTRRGTVVAFVCAGLLASVGNASASLIGAQATYHDLFPNAQTVQENLGTKTVTPLTTFTDAAGRFCSLAA
jgi:hypothetical protein